MASLVVKGLINLKCQFYSFEVRSHFLDYSFHQQFFFNLRYLVVPYFFDQTSRYYIFHCFSTGTIQEWLLFNCDIYFVREPADSNDN